MAATEYVILVNQEDQPLGIAEKLEAHQKQLCHRAFSVFILRENLAGSEVLLQQRAFNKYHCPGLWTNTCCSHPRPGEDIVHAAERRLAEEMGIITPLKRLGSFHYIAHFDNGLTENEVDHVLIGTIQADYLFTINADEVAAFRWVTFSVLREELVIYPEQFTPWLGKVLDWVEKEK